MKVRCEGSCLRFSPSSGSPRGGQDRGFSTNPQTAWSAPPDRSLVETLFGRGCDLLWRGFPKRALSLRSANHSHQNPHPRATVTRTTSTIRKSSRPILMLASLAEWVRNTVGGNSQRQSSQPPSFVSFARDKVVGIKLKMSAKATLCGAS